MKIRCIKDYHYGTMDYTKGKEYEITKYHSYDCSFRILGNNKLGVMSGWFYLNHPENIFLVKEYFEMNEDVLAIILRGKV